MTAEGWAFLIFAGLVWAGGYGFACWFWPFGSCPRCEGMGAHLSPSGKYRRDCRKCKGSGRRMRTGLRVWRFILGKQH